MVKWVIAHYVIYSLSQCVYESSVKKWEMVSNRHLLPSGQGHSIVVVNQKIMLIISLYLGSFKKCIDINQDRIQNACFFTDKFRHIYDISCYPVTDR